ncbi:MAG: HEAT repeat domain-containing protein [Caulobacteraceae bacterium]
MMSAEPDFEALARRWRAMVEKEDLGGFLASLSIRKRQIDAAKALVKADPNLNQRLVDLLILGLSDPRAPVRFEAAHALDQFGEPRCVPHLAKLMEDRVPRVRWMAMHALSCHACGEGSVSLAPEIVGRICEAVRSDPSPRVRRNAAIALGISANPAAAATLADILVKENDPKVAQWAEWAFDRCAEAP